MRNSYRSVHILLLTALLLVVGMSAPAQSADTPEAFVKEFYALYLKALVANKSVPAATMKRYLTAKFYKEVRQTTDADLIIQAQDYDDAWAKNITTRLNASKGNKSYVKVLLKGRDFSQELTVTLVATGKTWKIDNVADTDLGR